MKPGTTKLFNIYKDMEGHLGAIFDTDTFVRVEEILTFNDLMHLYLVHKSFREEGFLQPMAWFEYIPFDVKMWRAKTKKELSTITFKFAVKEMRRNWNYHNLPLGW